MLHAAGAGGACSRWPTPTVASAAGPPAPIDPQNWSWQDNLTWNDYKRAAGHGLLGPGDPPTVKKWKVALVVTDFPDKPFYRHAAAGQHGLRHADGGGARHPARRRPAFYRDFLNKPQALNHFQTMNRYWMEDSFGKYGVQLDAFGPYQLPGPLLPVLHDRVRRQRATSRTARR